MRVNIDEIKDSGLERTWGVPLARLEEALRGDRAGYQAVGPAQVAVRLERFGTRVQIHGSTALELTAPCGRCLVATRMRLPVEFDLSLVPEKEVAEAEGAAGETGDDQAEGSFTPRQVDEETYRGKVIDLDPFVEEQIALALPSYPVCQDGCKGLCPVCGQNQNEKTCGCDRSVPDPRWAGLEKFRQS
ncbi:MAG: DUF177 domain-containing protein [Deltaproteobacteria bacterium]